MKIKEIAEFLNAGFDGDGETEILRVASLESAQTSEISFFEKAENLSETKASVLPRPRKF